MADRQATITIDLGGNALRSLTDLQRALEGVVEAMSRVRSTSGSTADAQQRAMERAAQAAERAARQAEREAERAERQAQREEARERAASDRRARTLSTLHLAYNKYLDNLESSYGKWLDKQDRLFAKAYEADRKWTRQMGILHVQALAEDAKRTAAAERLREREAQAAEMASRRAAAAARARAREEAAAYNSERKLGLAQGQAQSMNALFDAGMLNGRGERIPPIPPEKSEPQKQSFFGGLANKALNATFYYAWFNVMREVPRVLGAAIETMQGADSALRQLTASSGSAKKAMEDFNFTWGYSLRSSLEFDQLLNGAKLLETYGLSVKKYLPTAAELSAAMANFSKGTEDANERMIRAVRVMQYLEGGTRQVGLLFRRLEPLGITRRDIMAQSENVRAFALDAKGKLLASSDEMLQKIVDIVHAKFGQVNQALEQSFAVAFSNIKGVAQRVLFESVGGFFPMLTRDIQRLLDVLVDKEGNLTQVAKDFASSLNAKLIAVYSTMRGMADLVREFGKEWNTWLRDPYRRVTKGSEVSSGAQRRDYLRRNPAALLIDPFAPFDFVQTRSEDYRIADAAGALRQAYARNKANIALANAGKQAPAVESFPTNEYQTLINAVSRGIASKDQIAIYTTITKAAQEWQKALDYQYKNPPKKPPLVDTPDAKQPGGKVDRTLEQVAAAFSRMMDSPESMIAQARQLTDSQHDFSRNPAFLEAMFGHPLSESFSAETYNPLKIDLKNSQAFLSRLTGKYEGGQISQQAYQKALQEHLATLLKTNDAWGMNNDEIDEVRKKLASLNKKEMKDMQKLMEEIALKLGDAFATFFTNLITGAQKASELLHSLRIQVAQIALQAGFGQLFKTIGDKAGAGPLLGIGAVLSLLPFATGIQTVPQDMPAMLHKGETVLPATMPLGPAGNMTTVQEQTTIYALDSQSFDDYFRTGPGKRTRQRATRHGYRV